MLLFALIFFMNVIPAFMPPTWIILSFFYLQYHLAFLPTVLLGVIAATSGRIILALIARRWLEPLLPKTFFSNYAYLGTYLEKNQKLTIPIVLGYAFSPISSNSLFIMAGLSNLPLHIIAFSFFIGRLISYSFWITASNRLSNRLEDIFAGSFASKTALINALFSLVIVFLIGKIKWKKILSR